jgi:capsular polysaccharide biosynthesis protein
MNEVSEEKSKAFYHGIGSDEETEIDLKELFYYLASKWKLLVLFVLLGASIAGAYHTFLLEPTYKADVSLYITNSDSLLTISDLQLSSALTDDYTQIITSRNVLNKVIEELDLDIDYNQLKDLITIENPSSSHIVCIYVTCDDQELCRDIANSVMNTSIEQIYRIIGSNEPTVIDRSELDYVVDVTPSMSKYVLIGALAGAVCIVAILVAKQVMDTSFKDEEDIEKILNVPVLAAIPYHKEIDNK